MTQGINDLINAIVEGDATAIDAAFNAEMANRVSSKLEDMRVRVAQNMFKAEQVEEVEQPTEETTEAEELEEASGYKWKDEDKEKATYKHSNFPETSHSKDAAAARKTNDHIGYHKLMAKHHETAMKHHEKHKDADSKTHGTKEGHISAYDYHSHNYNSVK